MEITFCCSYQHSKVENFDALFPQKMEKKKRKKTLQD